VQDEQEKHDSTLVLLDRETYSHVCGVHDTNLSVIEELFSTPVRARGNRLFLETADHKLGFYFAELVRELELLADSGKTIDEGVVRSVYSEIMSYDSDDENRPKVRTIEIPVSGAFVIPRSRRQATMIAGFDRYPLSFCVGPAGTGKTYLSVAHALREVLSKRYRKLILTRPVVEAGENLGFLPGDLSQKISPYLRPLYDAIETLLSREIITRMQEQGTIEVAPLAYMRGRSLRDAYVILDEAQNTTRGQMKMFLTRIGENSKAVVTGDVTQSDLPNPSRSGLTDALKVLAQIPEIGITYLQREDIIRSTLVRKIIKAYDEHRE